MPDPAFNGHFNVLRGYVDNHQAGLPSEMALLNLFDPRSGMPVAVLDATAITEMRTGALTALGARHLARPDAKVLGHIGARATSYWNVRLLDLSEIRVHSRRPESREAFAGRLAEELGKPVVVTEDWQSCVEGADIVVEASRLRRPEPLLRTEWISPGALVVPYGTNSAVELTLTDIMDKIVVDDWGQAHAGPFGALRAHVDSGRLNKANLHGELGEMVAGALPGRESAEETILFWHRGLSLSDIALGAAVLKKAAERGLGQRLRLA
ncbi:ornithine cyclodeaminase family protein [Streptomyces sp. NPDC002143]